MLPKFWVGPKETAGEAGKERSVKQSRKVQTMPVGAMLWDTCGSIVSG